MAIAWDAVGSGSSAGSATSLTYSHTVGAGLSNSILVVGASFYNGGISIDGITYNGVALTKVRRDNAIGAATTELWYLLSPASGANNVVITISSGSGGAGISSGSMSFSGVSQSSPIDAQNGGSIAAGNTSISLSVTTVANNAWIVDTMTEDKSPTVGGSQTQKYNALNTVGSRYYAGSYLGPVTPAGATSVSWSFASSGVATSYSAVSLTPAAAAAGKLFLPAVLDGMGGGGPFFRNPIN